MLRIAAFLLVSTAPAVASPLPPGLWYDRTSPGQGLDLQRAGDIVFGAVYSYDRDTRPAWSWFQLDERVGTSTELLRVRRTAPGIELGSVGAIALAAVSSCPDGLPRPDASALLDVRIELDGSLAQWCLEPLVANDDVVLPDRNGAWFDPREPGWGLFVHHYTRSGRAQVYATLYYQDAAGDPRWVFAQEAAGDVTQPLRFFALRNECFLCGSSPLFAVAVGDAVLSLGEGADRIVLAAGESGEAPFVRDVPLLRLGDRP